MKVVEEGLQDAIKFFFGEVPEVLVTCELFVSTLTSQGDAHAELPRSLTKRVGNEGCPDQIGFKAFEVPDYLLVTGYQSLER